MSASLDLKKRPPENLHIIIADATASTAPPDKFTLKYATLRNGKVLDRGTVTKSREDVGLLIADLAVTAGKNLGKTGFTFRLDNGIEHQVNDVPRPSARVPTDFLIPFCKALEVLHRTHPAV